jgi:hypothetical protein
MDFLLSKALLDKNAVLKKGSVEWAARLPFEWCRKKQPALPGHTRLQ